MQKFRTPNNSVPASGDVVERWLEHCASLTRDPITEKGAGLYRRGWASWLKFLLTAENAQGEHATWQRADGQLVTHFLRSGLRNRKAGTPVSDITRRRYFRMLERVYDFAVARQWVDSNPVLQIAEPDKPPPENGIGAVLLPRIWRATMKQFPGDDETDLVAIRNRALLLCLFELGLMPQEVRSLKLRDLLWGPCPDNAASGCVNGLSIEGTGPNQTRRLEVGAELSVALQRWVAARAAWSGSEPSGFLFCSIRRQAMTSANLLALCRQVLAQGAGAASLPLPVRQGPQIIRNTRIVLWLNEGVPPAQVVLRAGLKNLKGLRHLAQSVQESIRPSLVAKRDDEAPRQTFERQQRAGGTQPFLL